MSDTTEIEADPQALYRAGRYAEVLQIYTEWGNDGSVDAQNWVGWMHEQGEGTPVDPVEARRWYEMAVATDPAQTHGAIARVLVKQSRAEEAVRLLEIDAARGHAPAIYRLGLFHESGTGVPVDRDRALRFFEQAAAMGHLFARRRILGRMLRGEFGLLRIPLALMRIVLQTPHFLRVVVKDMHDDRLQGW
jgi:TPR repeat protein